MPRFDYQCEDCSEEFEYFIVRSDDNPVCPECGGTHLKKQVSLFAVGKQNASHGVLEKVRKHKDDIKNTKSNHISGCARGYAKSILKNYR